MRDKALTWLEKQMRKAQIRLSHSEDKPNVTEEEIQNVRDKIEVLKWLNRLVLNTEEAIF